MSVAFEIRQDLRANSSEIKCRHTTFLRYGFEWPIKIEPCMEQKVLVLLLQWKIWFTLYIQLTFILVSQQVFIPSFKCYIIYIQCLLIKRKTGQTCPFLWNWFPGLPVPLKSAVWKNVCKYKREGTSLITFWYKVKLSTCF